MTARHILIVDDDPAAAVITQHGLTRLLAPADVTVAPSPAAAWSECKRGEVDLVIVDPNPQRQETNALVRVLCAPPHDTQVLVLTAYDTPRLRREMQALGVQHYLAKPVALAQLATEVRAMLQPERAMIPAARPDGRTAMTDDSGGQSPHDRQVYYFATLKQIAEALNRGASTHQIVTSVLPLVVDLLGLHTGWLFLLDEQGSFSVEAHHNLPPAMAYPGQPWCDDCTCQGRALRGDLRDGAQVVECSRLRAATGDRHGLAYHASVPVVEGDRLLGVLNVATPQWDVFTPQDLQILTAVGYQLATAIQRSQLAEQATRIALVEERNRLAREVHDSLAQELAGIALQLEAADALLEREPARARARLQHALARTRESLAEARRSVLDLRAGPLEREDLRGALAGLAGRFASETGVALDTRLEFDEPRLPAAHEQALYRIAQEALANIRRHAQASRVELALRREGAGVALSVADDGRGFAGAGAAQGFGLISMRERANLLGGRFQISSCPDAGTRIEVWLPLEPAAP